MNIIDLKERTITNTCTDLKIRNATSDISLLKVRPFKKIGKSGHFLKTSVNKMNLVKLKNEIKKYVAPEIIKDINIYTSMLKTYTLNNIHDYTPDELKYIMHSYSSLLTVKRYQTNKMKSILRQSRNISFDFGMLFLPVEQMLNSYKYIFDIYSNSSVTGRWLKSIKFFGSLGVFVLMSYGGEHIKSGRFKTAGALWHYYGLTPSYSIKERVLKYKKMPKSMREYLFYLRYSIKYKDMSIYSDIYRMRLTYEIQRNESGGNAPYLENYAKVASVGRDIPENLKKFIQEGKMPVYFLTNRATKYAVKVFLSHFHHVLYYETFKKLPPKPYVLDHISKSHEMRDQIPNWPFD